VNSDSYKGVSAEGRVPPPEEYRIPKGKSGNYKGRPRGSVSRSKLIRKVANTTHRVAIDGISQRRTLLELLILKIQAMALNGNAGAASLMNDLFGLAIPPDPPEGCGFLVVPAPLSLEEFMAQENARNAGAREPGTYVNVKAEEFEKAARGEPSPLGEALHAFGVKFGTLPDRSESSR
jgi:hypothetical protein